MNFCQGTAFLQCFINNSGALEVGKRGRDERNSELSRHKADDGLHLNGLLRDPGTESGCFATTDHVVVKARRIWSREQDKGSVFKLLKCQLARPARKRVLCRQRGNERLAQ